MIMIMIMIMTTYYFPYVPIFVFISKLYFKTLM
jgi:hypothetical protein